MDQLELKLGIAIIGGLKMIKFITKAVKTANVVKKALPVLKKELLDLTGETSNVIEKIIDIWD